MKILVVDDDPLVAKTLEILFSVNSYATDIATDGEVALQMVQSFEYDLILLDMLLPGLDGMSLCQQVRQQGYQMPILLLTGQNETHQKAAALNLGADDYVVKPFDSEELIARVQALLRRGGSIAQPIMEWGRLQLDPGSHTVTYSEYLLSLTPKEYALLELFLRNSQRILSSKTILEHAWTSIETPGEETVRVHIKGLRQKLRQAGAPDDFIETVYRVGYRLKPIEDTLSVLSEQPQILESVAYNISEPAGMAVVPSPTLGPSTPDPDRVTGLFVTGNATLITQVKQLLEAKSLQLIALSDLRQFWQTLASYTPKVLIIDAQLPHDGGLELCRAVRDHPQWQGLAILFLIDSTAGEVVNQIFAAGADDFISQPMVGSELVARVCNRLNRQVL